MNMLRDAVRKDNFLRYPTLCEVAKEELKKREALKKAKMELVRLKKYVES